MQDLNKVNASQLFAFWKNFSYGLLVMTGTLVLSRFLPFYFSPIIGLVAAAFLYTLLYNNKVNASSTCMVIPYAMFYCIVSYALLTIVLNVLDIWNVVNIPKEFSFFNYPFIPALILDPVCFIVLLVFFLRRNRLSICIDCKISKGLSIERGRLGEILSSESRLQLVNMLWLFGLLTVVVWAYYMIWYYSGAVVNNRDWYIFVWINVFAVILDELYFASRYYNIYLDLKENGEIITESELSDMTTKTYLRYYLICGNKIYLNPKVADPSVPGKYVIDTPFVTKRNVNGITTSEVMGIVQRLTGMRGGELRFFFGRKAADLAKHRLLRYFYFLDGDVNDYPKPEVDGEWVDFETVKKIYSRHKDSMALTLLTDISRMVTVVLTQKLFDEHGYRKMKVKSYRPNVTLPEIREANYDFQDDKWIRISMYNSDIRSFKFKRFWTKMLNLIAPERKNKNEEWQDDL